MGVASLLLARVTQVALAVTAATAVEGGRVSLYRYVCISLQNAFILSIVNWLWAVA